MKIQETFPNVELISDTIFENIVKSQNKIEFLQHLQACQLNEYIQRTGVQFDLRCCILLLNILDQYLAEIVKRYEKGDLYLSDNVQGVVEVVNEMDSDSSELDEDIAVLKAILSLTATLLQYSFCKEWYSSVEYLLKLLRAFDDEVSMLALKCLLFLTIPPYHRHIDQSRHYTTLHRTPSLCSPIFDVIQSVSVKSQEELLKSQYIPDDNDFCFVRSHSASSSSSSSKVPAAEDASKFRACGSGAPSSDFGQIQIDMLRDIRSYRTLINTYFAGLSCQQQFVCLWSLRARRFLSTQLGRMHLLWINYAGVAITLSCCTDTSLLTRFFQDKTHYLGDFLFLLRNGPGTSDYSPDLVPIDIRCLAVVALCAIVGSRESAAASVLGRFTWLQQDLGVSRGEYMGLLPCLLRAGLAVLASDSSLPSSEEETSLTDPIVGRLARCPSRDIEHLWRLSPVLAPASTEDIFLLWMESILSLAIALVNMTFEALPTFTLFGIVQSLIAVLAKPPSLPRSPFRVYIDCLVLQLLDSCLGHQTQPHIIFREQHGDEILLERIKQELLVMEHISRISEEGISSSDVNFSVYEAGTSASQAIQAGFSTRITSSSPAVNMLIYHMLEVITMFYHDEQHGEYGTSSNVQGFGLLIKGPSMGYCIAAILANPTVLTSMVVSRVLHIMMDSADNDLAPPGIVSHFLTSGLALATIKLVFLPQPELIFSESDTIDYYTHLINALCLTQDGEAMVIEVNPFPSLFLLFIYAQNYCEPRGALLSDCAGQIGVNLEELIRHHPKLMPLCLEALVLVLHTLTLDTKIICCGLERVDALQYYSSPASEAIAMFKGHLQKLFVTSFASMEDPSSLFHNIICSYLARQQYSLPLINEVDVFVMRAQAAAALCAVLEALLTRKQTAVAVMQMPCFMTVIHDLREISMGPHITVYSSLMWAVNPFNLPVGHIPLVQLLGRCTGQLMEFDTRNFVRSMVYSLGQQNSKLLQNLALFHAFMNWGKSGPFESGGKVELSAKLLVPGLFNHLLKQTCFSSDKRQYSAEEYKGMALACNIFRSLVMVGNTIDALARTMRWSLSNHNAVSTIAEIMDEDATKCIFKSIFDLYQNCQIEFMRIKDEISKTKSLHGTVHPKYRLLVIARESIGVRDSSEDNGKKICRYDRGSIITAYERVLSGTTMVKFRTDDGWINLYKGTMTMEPQVEIIDFSPKSNDEQNAELEKWRNEAPRWSIIKSLSYEQLTDTSCHRVGFVAIMKLHTSMRELVSSVSKIIYPPQLSSTQKELNFFPMAPVYLSMMLSNLNNSVPAVKSVFTDDYYAQWDAAVAAVEEKKVESTSVTSGRRRHVKPMKPVKLSAADDALESSCGDAPAEPTVAVTDDFDPEVVFGTFPTVKVPTLSQFRFGHLYLSVHVCELATAMLYDDRTGSMKSRSESQLMLIYSLWTDNILERVIAAGVAVVLTCLSLCETTISADNGESSIPVIRAVDDNSEIDDLFLSQVSGAKFEDPAISTVQIDDLEDIVAARRFARAQAAVHDRKLKALASVDGILEFLRYLLASCSAQSETKLDKILGTQEAKYSPHLYKFHIVQSVVRHLSAVWSHPLLFSLPLQPLRIVLELQQQAAKCFQGSFHSNVRDGLRRFLPLSVRADMEAFNFDIVDEINDMRTLDGLPSIDSGSETGMDNPPVPMIESNTLPACESINSNELKISEYTIGPELSTFEEYSEFIHTLPSDENIGSSMWPLAPLSSILCQTPPTESSNLYEVSLKFCSPFSIPDELGTTNFSDKSRIMKSFLLTMAPMTFFRIIERTSMHWFGHRNPSHSDIALESVTMVALTALFKALEVASWRSGGLKYIILSWLHKRGVALLSEQSRLQQASVSFSSLKASGTLQEINCRLYTVLHCIAWLLSNQTLGVSSLRSPADYFSIDIRYLLLYFVHGDECHSRFHELVSESVLTYHSRHPAQMQTWRVPVNSWMPPALRSATLEKVQSMWLELDVAELWIVPAMLLVDIASQSLLVDARSMQTTFAKLNLALVCGSDNCFSKLPAVCGKKLSDSGLKRIQSMLGDNESSCPKQAGASTATQLSSQSATVPLGKKRSFDKVSEDTASARELPTKLNHDFSSDEDTDKVNSKSPLLLLRFGPNTECRVRLIDALVLIIGSVNGLIERMKTIDKDSPAQSRKPNNIVNALVTTSVWSKNFVVSLAHAALQVIARFTRDNKPRLRFIKCHGLPAILKLQVHFPAMSNLVFTITQHVLEEPQYLQSTMEATIKLCFARLSGKSADTSRPLIRAKKLPLVNLMEVLLPLVMRSQKVFFKALTNVCEFHAKPGPKDVTVQLKSASFSCGAEKSSPKMEHLQLPPATPAPIERRANGEVCSSNSGASGVATPATKRMRSSSNPASLTSSTTNTPATLAGPRVPPSATSKYPSHNRSPHLQSISAASKGISSGFKNSLDMGTLQASTTCIVDELFANVVAKWTLCRRLWKDQQPLSDEETGLVEKLIRSQTISDMLFELGDLASTVPAIGATLHKRHINSRDGFTVSHAITHLEISNPTIISVVIHELLTFAAFLIVPIQKRLGLAAVFVENSDNSPQKSKREEYTKLLAGTNLKDATSYLIAAMVCRPGDCRKRILIELLSPLQCVPIRNSPTNLPDDPSIDNHYLGALTALGETVSSLLRPPASWQARETFVWPLKEVMNALLALEADQVLANAICTINLRCAYAAKAITELTVPLDFLIRRLPKARYEITSEEQLTADIASVPPGEADANLTASSMVCPIESNSTTVGSTNSHNDPTTGPSLALFSSSGATITSQNSDDLLQLTALESENAHLMPLQGGDSMIIEDDNDDDDDDDDDDEDDGQDYLEMDEHQGGEEDESLDSAELEEIEEDDVDDLDMDDDDDEDRDDDEDDDDHLGGQNERHGHDGIFIDDVPNRQQLNIVPQNSDDDEEIEVIDEEDEDDEENDDDEDDSISMGDIHDHELDFENYHIDEDDQHDEMGNEGQNPARSPLFGSDDGHDVESGDIDHLEDSENDDRDDEHHTEQFDEDDPGVMVIDSEEDDALDEAMDEEDGDGEEYEVPLGEEDEPEVDAGQPDGWRSLRGVRAGAGANRRMQQIQLGLDLDGSGNISDIRIQGGAGATRQAAGFLRVLSQSAEPMRLHISGSGDRNQVMELLDSLTGAFSEGSGAHGPARARPIRLHREPNINSILELFEGDRPPERGTAANRLRRPTRVGESMNVFHVPFGSSTSSATAANAVENGLHPLLAASATDEARRGSGRSLSGLFFPPRDDLEGNSQSSSNNASRQRKSLGPLVSDRRWGVDNVEISRIDNPLSKELLVTMMHRILESHIQIEALAFPDVGKSRPTNSKPSSSKSDRSPRLHIPTVLETSLDSQFDIPWLNIFDPINGGSSSGGSSADPPTATVDSDSSAIRPVLSDPAIARMEVVAPTEIPISAQANAIATSDASMNSVLVSAAPILSAAVSTSLSSSATLPLSEGANRDADPSLTSEVDAEARRRAITARHCPTDVDLDVWNELPFEMQIEILNAQGHHSQAALLLEQEISASGVDRDVLLALPPEMRQQVLGEEVNERRRRNSFDSVMSDGAISRRESFDAAISDHVPIGSDSNSTAVDEPASTDAVILENVSTSAPFTDNAGSVTGTDAAVALEETSPAQPTLSENALFLESLPPDLRRDVLVSAEPEFLATLPPAARLEAQRLRQAMGINIGDLQAQFDQYAAAAASRSTGTFGLTTSSSDRSIDNQGQADNASSAPSGTKSDKEKQKDEEVVIRSISLADDHPVIDCVLPFSKLLMLRLCHSLLQYPKSNAPKPVLRLLASCCKYRLGRRIILETIFACIFRDTRRLADICNDCHDGVVCGNRRLRSNSNGEVELIADTDSMESLQQERDSICSFLTSQVHDSAQNESLKHRLVGVLHFLVRKTERLVWYEILDKHKFLIATEPFVRAANRGSMQDAIKSYPTQLTSNEPYYWLFEKMFELLAPGDFASMETVDSVLGLVELVCGALDTLSPAEATALVHWQQPRRPNNQILPALSDCDETRQVNQHVTDDASCGLDLDCDEPVAKKVKHEEKVNTISDDIAAIEPVFPEAVVLSSSSSNETAVTDSSSPNMFDIPSNLEFFQLGTFPVPFPVLNRPLARVLAELVSRYASIPSQKKRLARCLKPLALFDGNWELMLDEMASVGHLVQMLTLDEMSVMLNVLKSAKPMEDSATSTPATRTTASVRLITTLPQLSAPSLLPELQLLQLLRMMSSLRSKKSTSGSQDEDGAYSHVDGGQSEAVAMQMRKLDCEPLWIVLCECLDVVRNLEGLVDLALEEDEEVTADGSVRSTNLPATPRSHRTRNSLDRSFASESSNASALSVAGAAVASNTGHHRSTSRASSRASDRTSGAGGAGADVAEDASTSSKVLSTLTSRFIPLIECFLTICGATLLRQPKRDEATGKSSGLKRKADSSFALSTLSTGGSPSRTTTSVLGERFRQHAGYWQMQMELDDSSESAARLIRFAERNRLLLNLIIRHNTGLLETSFAPLIVVPRCRPLLHFDIKRAYFKMKLKRMRQAAPRNFSGSLRISVRRQYVFEDSFQSLRHKSADDMRRRLSVTFHGEEGLDAGGLTREWYSVLAREIFNANYALFVATSDSVTFQPNRQSFVNPEHLSYFKFVGRIIGKAICDGHLLDAHFTRSFYKHILGLPVSFHDLEAIEPEYYKSLKQVLEFPIEDLGLDLSFSTESDDFGQMTVVDLIENGRNIPVTDENKYDYVQLVAHHRMTTSIRKQIDAFLEGFHELVPSELICLFDAQELELLISGLPDVDIDDLRAHTEYHGYKPSDPQIDHFWAVLRSFTKEEKALFLQFVTGSSKVPLEGFANLQGAEGVKQFNIHKAYGAHLLPSAHTCFNQLDLPEYDSEEITREKLLIAIREGSEGFGFV